MLELNGIDCRDWLCFDPADIPRLFAQDEAIACGFTDGFTVSAKPRTDAELAIEFVALREAGRLPLSDVFLAFIAGEERRAEEEISTRLLDAPGVWRELPVG